MNAISPSFFSKLVGLHLTKVIFADDGAGHLGFDPILKKRTWAENVFCSIYAICRIAVSQKNIFSCSYVLDTTDSVRRNFEQQLYGLLVTAVRMDERDNSLHVLLENDFVVSVLPDEKGHDYGEWVLYCEEFCKNTHYVFWKNCVDYEVEAKT
jgi:hypothetical protein